MIKWTIKPTRELNSIEKKQLDPVDKRSTYYIWAAQDDHCLASATLINLPTGIVLDLNNAQDLRLGVVYRLFGVISRISDPKPTVVLNPQPSDETFYIRLGFTKKGNTYTKTVNL